MVSPVDLVSAPSSDNGFVTALTGTYAFRPGYKIVYVLQGNPGDTSPMGGALWAQHNAATAFSLATQAWAAVANITTTAATTGYDGSGSRAAYTWVESLSDLGAGLLGSHSLPGPGDMGGDFNNAISLFSAANNAVGGYSFLTFLHEIGHGLGLTHPHEEGNSFPGVDGDDDTGDNGFNQAIYTVMSYNDGIESDLSPSDAYGWSATPMAFDIAAIQNMYGANMSTAAGDNVYVLPTVNGSGTFWSCIWDAGGNDTISAASVWADSTIDLRAATLLNAEGGAGWLTAMKGVAGGFTIAHNVVIENAIGGTGNDTIRGNDVVNILRGGDGEDQLWGGAGDDWLIGDAGNDTMYGEGGTDLFIGGLGDDKYNVDSANELVFENAGEGTDTIVSTVSLYLFGNIEKLELVRDGSAVFGVGNALDNEITGNQIDNLLLGGAGNDLVHGSDGNDQIYGEDGDDWIIGDAGIDYVVGGAGNDRVEGGYGADALYGGDGDDNLYADITDVNGGASVAQPDFVTDILVGGDGNDTLRGASGRGDYDLMDGGAGNDTYYVDTTADLTFEAGDGGTDTVFAKVVGNGYYLYANVENLTLIGQTAFGVGNDLANLLTGSAASNWLLGGAGNDVLNGKEGDDVLFGEAGADVFVFEAGSGGDTIGDFAAGTDRIDLSAFGFTSFAQVQAAMIENGGTTAIILGTDYIVLNGVAKAVLHAGDFIISGGSEAIQPVDQRVAVDDDRATVDGMGFIHRFDSPHLFVPFGELQ